MSQLLGTPFNSHFTVLAERDWYFVLTIFQTGNRFEICLSWCFQNTPYMSNFWLRYLRLKTHDFDYWPRFVGVIEQNKISNSYENYCIINLNLGLRFHLDWLWIKQEGFCLPRGKPSMCLLIIAISRYVVILPEQRTGEQRTGEW